jgi:hypothetical protein
MITQDKQDRREIVKRSTVIYDRLRSLYEKYCPDGTMYLADARKYNKATTLCFTEVLRHHARGDLGAARTAADDYYYSASRGRDQLVNYIRSVQLDRVLLEKHIRKFALTCTNPYVEAADPNVGASEGDKLCFDVGPYDLKYDGGQVRVGPFRVKIDIAYCFKWDGSDHFKGFQAFKANQWAYEYQGRIHPHDMSWGSNRICTGEAGVEIWKAIKAGRVMDAVRYTEAVLSTYKNQTCYTNIFVFAQKKWKKKDKKDEAPAEYTCRGCGNEVHEDDVYNCEECGNAICEGCYLVCGGCDNVYCEDHLCAMHECRACGEEEYECDDGREGAKCWDCGDYYCGNHIYYCEACGNNCCGDHSYSCGSCGDVYCGECVTYDEETDESYCGYCYEKLLKERAEEEGGDE